MTSTDFARGGKLGPSMKIIQAWQVHIALCQGYAKFRLQRHEMCQCTLPLSLSIAQEVFLALFFA
jgi:hypothetical protein